MGTLVWSPLAGGWLSGRFRKGHDLPTTHRSDRSPERYNLGHARPHRRHGAAGIDVNPDDAGFSG
ncbi:MAG: oxidoreductase [Microbacteriaceae bacterium]|jgi:aryl-alcohol dehydrogenase-like predicted oxidoreductase|nr:oxidoreductase [Microbacteriaceae bacterium]